MKREGRPMEHAEWDGVTATHAYPSANPPRRRLELTLTLGTDTLDDLASALEQIATDLLIEGREEHTKANGGWSSGYLSLLTVDPDMDGDRYRREVQEHFQKLGNQQATRDTEADR